MANENNTAHSPMPNSHPSSLLRSSQQSRSSSSITAVDNESSLLNDHLPSDAYRPPLGSRLSIPRPISIHTYESQTPSRNTSCLRLTQSQTHPRDDVRSSPPVQNAQSAERPARHRGFTNDHSSSFISPQLHDPQVSGARLTSAELRWLNLGSQVRNRQQPVYETDLSDEQRSWLGSYHERVITDSDPDRPVIAEWQPTGHDVDGMHYNTRARAWNDEVELLSPDVYVPNTSSVDTGLTWVTPNMTLDPMDHESARPSGLHIRKEDNFIPPIPPRSPGHTIDPKYLRQNNAINANTGERKRVPRPTSFLPRHMTPQDMPIPHHTHVEDCPKRLSRASRTLGLLRDTPTNTFDQDDETNLVQESSAPPDGGTLAWMHAWSGMFVVFNTWGLITSFGIFEAFYQYTFLLTTPPQTIAWIGSVQAFFILFLGTPIGLAMDKGYCRVFIHGGSVLLVSALFLWSACSQWWHFFVVQGLLQGTGMGMIFCSGTIVLMTYFDKHIGTATAIAALGAPLGTIVYTLAFVHLQPKLGFPWTVRVIAFIAFATLCLPNVVFRQRRGIKRCRGHANLSTFIDAPYLVMSAGLFFAYWGVLFGYYYIPLFGVHWLNLRGDEAVNLVVAMAAANIPGRLIPGLISDKCIGPLNTLIPSCILSAAVTLVWIGTTNYPSLIVVACLYGFASAGIQALYAPTTHSFSYLDPATMGQRSGAVFTIISFACLTGPPIGGALITRNGGGFLYAQLFAGVSLFVGGTLLLIARYLKVGWTPARA